MHSGYVVHPHSSFLHSPIPLCLVTQEALREPHNVNNQQAALLQRCRGDLFRDVFFAQTIHISISLSYLPFDL